MENFWKWLMRANAKGVFICSLLALLAVTAWWAVKSVIPLKDDTEFSRKKPERIETEFGILAFLEAEMSAEKISPGKNPFRYGVVMAPRREVRAPRSEFPVKPPSRPVMNLNTNKIAEPKPSPPSPVPIPEPENITLIYKGVYVSTDGQVKAYVNDSKKGGNTFLKAGDELHGMKVGRISKRTLAIVTAEGVPVLLNIEEPCVFSEGKKYE